MNVTFKLEIEMGNAAMSLRSDVADALSGVAVKMHRGQAEGIIIDSNGNTVGKFWME